MNKIFALAIAALAMASCGSGDKAQESQETEQQEGNTGATAGAGAYAAPSLAGQWQLIEYTGDKPLEINGEYVLTMEEDSFSMQTDCNSIQGMYEAKADSISFVNPMKTEMACDNEAVEQAMSSLFANARTFWLYADTLTLKTETAESGKFLRK